MSEPLHLFSLELEFGFYYFLEDYKWLLLISRLFSKEKVTVDVAISFAGFKHLGFFPSYVRMFIFF